MSNLLDSTDTQPTTAEFCEVVFDNECTAAPSYETKTRARCFACGLPVCTSCSTVRSYFGTDRRICFSCERQVFEDGEARQLVRAHHRAGYPDYRLADAREQLANESRQRAGLRGI